MKNRTRKLGLLLLVQLAMPMLCAGSAWAILVGPNETAPKSEIEGNYQESIMGWVFGSEQNPIDVTFDGASGPLVKTLAGSPSGAPGLTFTLHEFIRVEAGTPWQQWHEQITTEGWDWVGGTVSIDGTVISNGVVSGDNLAIGFDFDDPLQPGTMIEIVKQFTYVGVPTHHPLWPGQPLVIQVFEHPLTDVSEPIIPEPATLSLLGMGMAMMGMGGVARRRRLQKEKA